MAVTVNFNSVLVNSMQQDSGVFFGENNQFGWDSHAKRLSGNSAVIGQYNFFTNFVVVLNNNVVIDTPINDQDVKIGTQTQSV